MDISDISTKMESEDDANIASEVPFPNKAKIMENKQRCVGLLDLSDDVLLYILQHCSPRDLKALGFTCERFGHLVRDHTLWHTVDARGYPSGVERVKWLLMHVLNSGTKELLLSGFARDNYACLENTNENIKSEIEDITENYITAKDVPVKEKDENINNKEEQQRQTTICRQHARLHFAARQLPRYMATCTRSPFSDEPKVNSFIAEDCPGPQFTFTQPMFKQLKSRCPNLTSLSLEYCNINYRATGLCHFPPTLKKLSLRGVRFYNLPVDKSVLFNIHCHLPELEYLDLSECSWLEPLCMLTLSKITNLKHLLMRDCVKMREFVAYASLATRYGFFKLQVLDLRGTPVGDSEVSALGWLPELQELYLSPCRNSALNSEDKVESTKVVSALESWELEEPDYYKLKYQEEQEFDISENENEMKSNTWTSTDSPTTLATSNMPSSNLSVKINNNSPVENGIKRKLSTSSSNNDCHQYHGPPKKRKKTTRPNDDEHSTPRNDTNPAMDNSTERNDQIMTFADDNSHVGEPSTSETILCSSDADNQNESSTSETNQRDDNNRLSIYFKRCRCTNDDSNNKEPSSSNVELGIVINNSKEKSDQVIEPSDKSICNSEVDSNNCDQPSTSNSNENSDNRNDGTPRTLLKDYTPILYVSLGSSRAHYLTNNDRYRLISVTHHNSPPESSLLDLTLHQAHIDPTALVTDSAIRRFGRADGDVNLTVIAPLNDSVNHNSRPDRSNLRILSATGYRDITNRSLVHLVTAAPHLRLIDFSNTRVTTSGVETFRSLRPDCEVIFSDDND